MIVLTELTTHPRVQRTRQRVVVDRLLILSGGRLQRGRLLVRVDHHLIMVSRGRRDDGLLLLLLVVVRTQVAEVRLLLLLLLVVRLWRRCRMVVLLLLLLVMMVTGGRHLLLVVVGHVDHVGRAARLDETVGHRRLELARGVHDGRVAVHGHLAHATATASAAAADQAAADGRLGPAVAVHGRLVVVVVVAGRRGRLPDLHPVVGREPRVRHALGRLSTDRGPDVVVRRYALPGGRVTRRVVHIVLLAVVVVVHDHATSAATAAADDSADAAEHAASAAATSDETAPAAAASAIPHVGRHVRVGKVRAHVQQVAAIALHFAGH